MMICCYTKPFSTKMLYVALLCAALLLLPYQTIAKGAAAEEETDCKFPDVKNRVEAQYKITKSQVEECVDKGWDPPPQLLPTENEGTVLPASHTVFAGQFAPSEPPGSAAGSQASGKNNALVGALIGGLLGGIASDFDGQYDVEAQGHPDAEKCGMKGDTQILSGEYEVNEFQCGGSVTGLPIDNYLMAGDPALYGIVDPEPKQLILYQRQADKYAYVKRVQLPVDWCENGGGGDNGGGTIHHPITYKPQHLTFPAEASGIPIELLPGNYDHENEVVTLSANGTNISVPPSCQSKSVALAPYPAIYPGIRILPSEEQACYKQYIYPAGGFCDGNVLHINKDDTTFAYEPGTRMESLPIQGTDMVMVKAGFGTKLFVQSNLMKMGFGQTIHFPDGALIALPGDQELFVNGPIDLFVDSGGQIQLPHGGVHYAADGTVLNEYDSSLTINVSPSHGPLDLEINGHFVYTDTIVMPANPTTHYMRAAYPATQEVQLAPLN